jgi:hypothetical protein
MFLRAEVPHTTHGFSSQVDFASKGTGSDCSSQLRSRQDKFVHPIKLCGNLGETTGHGHCVFNGDGNL